MSIWRCKEGSADNDLLLCSSVQMPDSVSAVPLSMLRYACAHRLRTGTDAGNPTVCCASALQLGKRLDGGLVCREEESLGDISTLADPSVVKTLLEMRRQ